ncbi:MAG: 1-acyl-sn-glycerol-3-phosphate acyltransferase [Prevotellaceae bacterium]|nr:1-acyl-sn-glycerol-3-phosphate acyltransferase [Prevotellaceae bacterium]
MTHDLHDFDDIRPFSDEEVGQGIKELLADPQFNQLLKGFTPWLPEGLRNTMLKAASVGVRSTLDFQVRFMKPVIKQLLRKCATSYKFDYEGIAPGEERYTFISNHRDIVLDSAILNMMLNDAKFPTTSEVAIGDNLLVRPWIRTLVRLNKSFLVRRSLPRREMLEASRLLSEYMHYVINQKRDNIWIAQREGRAKDSDDRTQESLLKMMTMGGEGTPLERLKDLHIVPVSISYEYDPCDYLKAEEFQLKRDNPEWKKSKQDDFDNMKTGILGKKGHIYYHASPCINTWLDELASLPKAELFHAVAQRIDREIHRGYRLWAGNYVAEDLLSGVPHNAELYTHSEKLAFQRYVQSRLALIDIPDKDNSFLRERILTMYANPARNHRLALKTE